MKHDAAAHDSSRLAAAVDTLADSLCSPLAGEEVEIAEPLARAGHLPLRQ